jgi:hypothetical protein
MATIKVRIPNSRFVTLLAASTGIRPSHGLTADRLIGGGLLITVGHAEVARESRFSDSRITQG